MRRGIHASRVPSGGMRGLIRSGLPKMYLPGNEFSHPLCLSQRCPGGRPPRAPRAPSARGDLRPAVRGWPGSAGRPPPDAISSGSAIRPSRPVLGHLDVMDGHRRRSSDLARSMTMSPPWPCTWAVLRSWRWSVGSGYGHGMIPAAAAALAGGAHLACVAEAVALRQAGVTVPAPCLLAAPDAPHEEAIRHDVDLSAGGRPGPPDRAAARCAGRGAAGAAPGRHRAVPAAARPPRTGPAGRGGVAAQAAGQARSHRDLGRTWPAPTFPGTRRPAPSWRRS